MGGPRSFLVTVVIPAYNAERFLTDAIDSVLNQTWKALEVVIVNDGSTDDTMALAEQFSRQDGRVMVVNKPNGGLSSARNAGIMAQPPATPCASSRCR